MQRRLPWRHVAAVAIWSMVGAALEAQELIPQPHGDFILVDVHSLRDEVQLLPGPLQDPPYLYRGWTRTQMVDLSPAGAFSMLRIWDRSLIQGGRRETETWQFELMPASAMALSVRNEGGEGKYDLSGMPLQGLEAFGFSATLRFDFEVPNPERLESAWIGVHDGKLELSRLLHARPRAVVIRLSDSSARIDLGGQPFTGRAQIVFLGAPDDLDLEVPRDVGLQVEGPPRVLRTFEAPHMEVQARALRSRGFEESPCQLTLLFEPGANGVSVRWTQAGAPPLGEAPETGGSAPDPLERNFERQLTEFLVLAAKGEQEAAVRKLRDLKDLAPGDGRLLFLETWLRERPAPEFNVVPVLGAADQRFREGLDFYVTGRTEEALERFRAAVTLDPSFEAARAWVGKAEGELQARRQPPPPPPPAPEGSPNAQETQEPRVVERVVVQTAAPVFAMRFPHAATTSLRGRQLEISGQVGDDVGIDRIEVEVNGEALRDPVGNIVMLHPLAPSDSARSLPFSVVVPLRPGRNEIVLTAFDRDATVHSTRQRLVVLRRPPFYRTGAFVAVLAALGLMVAAVALLRRARHSRGV